MCDCTTNTITADVQIILAHLIRGYGVVGTDTLSIYKQKVRNMQCDLLDPLVTITTQVEELEQLGITAENPYLTA